MHPAYWPAQPGNVVRNLYFVSSGFYVRVAEPTDDEPLPPVKLGDLEAFRWDRKGTEKFSPQNANRLHSDVNLLDGKLHTAMWSYQGTPETSDVRDMEHSSPTSFTSGFTVPLAWRPNSSSTIRFVAMQVARRALVGSWGQYGVHFVRRSDQAEVNWFGYDSLADPAGYRSWQYHQNAVSLTYGAINGPLAYGSDRFIATSERVYSGATGGNSVPERANIVGFTGLDGETAKWITIGGVELIGTTVLNQPVGHLGVDHVVFQQAALETLQNPNPATGGSYSSYSPIAGYNPDGTPIYGSGNYAITGYNQDNTPIYGSPPFNAFAGWGSNANMRYLWSGRVYRVDIVDTVDDEGKVNTVATRTLIGQCINEWRQKDYTGKDPKTNNDWVYYTRVYDSATGQYIYTPELDPDTKKPKPIPAQYIPGVQSELQQDGTRKEIGNAGYVLCSLMLTRNGPYEKRWPWNGPTNMTETNAQGQSSYIPAGMVEVNPSLWLGLSRITNNQTGARWIYSRDKGGTWNWLPAAAPSSLYSGMTAVRKDMAIANRNIYNEILAAEGTL